MCVALSSFGCTHSRMSHGNIDVLVLSFMYTSLAETIQQVAVLQQSCSCADVFI
jgi:hypothetical protein